MSKMGEFSPTTDNRQPTTGYGLRTTNFVLRHDLADQQSYV
jgi:hypothetical protein